MKIGYPSFNLTLHPRGDKAFTVTQRAKGRALAQAGEHISELSEILVFNAEKGLLFFRVRPDLIPLAADPAIDLDWAAQFGQRLRGLGDFARAHHIRLSVHADLFTMLNHPDPKQLNASIRDLYYQCELFEVMGLDQSHKIQIHAGERFNKDKERSIAQFCERFAVLDDHIKRRLVIENENVLCTVKDCLGIHIRTGLPIVPDVLHHEITAGDEGIHRVIEQCIDTWGACDGPMMVDYSSQQPGKMSGKHSESLNLVHFRNFVDATRAYDFDLMMENKDREKSALEALHELKDDPRVKRGLETPPASCEA